MSVVLDPPREGARRPVVEQVVARRPRVVAYVACDPAALARDNGRIAAKRPGELLTGLKIAQPAGGSGAGYQKLGLRQAMEIALVNVAAVVVLESDGSTIKEARVALGAVAPTPLLSPGAAQALHDLTRSGVHSWPRSSTAESGSPR